MGVNLSKAPFLSDVNKWFETEAHTCLCDVFFNIRFLGSKETKHAHNMQSDNGQGGCFYCTTVTLFYLFWTHGYHFEMPAGGNIFTFV